MEQVGHIGIEVARARHWDERNRVHYRDSSLECVLQLVDLTLRFESKPGRLYEMGIFRNVIQDILDGTRQYGCSLESLERFCMPFAILARTRETAQAA